MLSSKWDLGEFSQQIQLDCKSQLDESQRKCSVDVLPVHTMNTSKDFDNP